VDVHGNDRPKPFVRKDPTKVQPVRGCPATIRTILCRELYRYVVVWNQSQKRDEFRQVNQRRRPAEDIKLPVNEDLRIVSDELWERVRSARGYRW
jgi:hypothetical protein